MSISRSGDPAVSFKWYYRPESKLPIVQIIDNEQTYVKQAEIPDLLREIDDRHWNVVRQLLIEAKMRAESMLAREDIVGNAQMLSHYSGWFAYASYVFANLDGLRSGVIGVPDEQPVR